MDWQCLAQLTPLSLRLSGQLTVLAMAAPHLHCLTYVDISCAVQEQTAMVLPLALLEPSKRMPLGRIRIRALLILVEVMRTL
jgi:hypothetical protein